MANRTKKLSKFQDLQQQLGNSNLQNVKFPFLDLRENDPANRNKNINFIKLKDEVLNRNNVPNVIYVNKKGNDANDGQTFNTAKLTIKAALEAAQLYQFGNDLAFFNKTQDAANLILKNKQFIVDEALMRTVQFSGTPAGGGNALNDVNQIKCRRDLGYIVEAVIKDLRLGGNLNCIQAAATYYDTVNGNSTATLILTPTQKAITLYSFSQLNELCQAAANAWQGYSGAIMSSVERYFPTLVTQLNPSAPNIQDQVKTGDCADILSAIGTYFDIISSIINVGIESVTASVGPNNVTVYVAPGTYIEENPLFVPPNVAVVGDNLRATNVIPKYPRKDIFNVNNGTYIYGFTFSGHVDKAAVVSFPATGAGVIVRSPYVQNCTSLTSDGTGMRVDGTKAEGLKSMVLDAFSQYNQGGTGIEIINGGYAQLVSIFEICCEKAVYVNNGATCSITNSNTDFGKYGLYAEGTSAQQYTKDITGTPITQRIIRDTDEDVNGLTFKISGIPQGQRPYVGQGITIGQQYYFIKDIEIIDGGSNYPLNTTITVKSPSGPEGITAELIPVIEDGVITNIITAVSGTQYRVQDFANPGTYILASDPTNTDGIEKWPKPNLDPQTPLLREDFIIISPPEGGTPAQIKVTVEPVFYTVASSTPRDSNGVCEVTILEKLPFLPNDEDIVRFYQLSRMIVSSHCFEYVGAGTNISDAIPAKGGVPIQANEVFTTKGARIVFTSTDHIGNFRIGPDLVINQDTGTLKGRTFDKSLFSTLTPFILAIQ